MGVSSVANRQLFDDIRAHAANAERIIGRELNQKEGYVECSQLAQAVCCLASLYIKECGNAAEGNPFVGVSTLLMDSLDREKDGICKANAGQYEVVLKAIGFIIRACDLAIQGQDLYSEITSGSTIPPKKTEKKVEEKNTESSSGPRPEVNVEQPPVANPELKKPYEYSPFLVFAPNTSVVSCMNQVAQALEKKMNPDTKACAKTNEKAVSILSNLFRDKAVSEPSKPSTPSSVSSTVLEAMQHDTKERLMRENKNRIEKATKVWNEFLNSPRTSNNLVQSGVITTLLDDNIVLSNLVFTKVRLGGANFKPISLQSLANYQSKFRKTSELGRNKNQVGRNVELPEFTKFIRTSNYDQSVRAKLLNRFSGSDEKRRANHIPIFEGLQTQLKLELVGNASASLDNPTFLNQLAWCLGVKNTDTSSSSLPPAAAEKKVRADVEAFLQQSANRTPELAQKLVKFVAKCYVAGVKDVGEEQFQGGGHNLDPGGNLLRSLIDAQEALKPIECKDEDGKVYFDPPGVEACKQMISDLLNNGLGLGLTIGEEQKSTDGPDALYGANSVSLDKVPEWEKTLDHWVTLEPSLDIRNDRKVIVRVLKEFLKPIDDIQPENAVKLVERLLQEYEKDLSKEPIRDQSDSSIQIETLVKKILFGKDGAPSIRRTLRTWLSTPNDPNEVHHGYRYSSSTDSPVNGSPKSNGSFGLYSSEEINPFAPLPRNFSAIFNDENNNQGSFRWDDGYASDGSVSQRSDLFEGLTKNS